MISLRLQRNVSPNLVQTQASQTDRNVIERVVLQPGEVHRVGKGYRHLRIVSGQAWVTQSGKDVTLASGEYLELARERNGTVVSALAAEVGMELA